MTANELADELVWIAKNRGDSISRQLADIVCQQQAEIESLQKELQKIKIWCGKTQFVHDYSSPFIELQKASEK